MNENRLSKTINLAAFCFIILIVLWFIITIINRVPEHRMLQAVIFTALGLPTCMYLIWLFLKNFRKFILASLLLLPVIPYFERFLEPFFGNPFLRIGPQLFIICLLTIGALPRLKQIMQINWISGIMWAWLIANIIALIFSKDILLSLPPFLIGVVGPVLLTMIIANLFLVDKKGFKEILTVYWASAMIYLLFSIVVLLINLPEISLMQIIESRMGTEFARGPYGSNALPAYTILVMPLLIWSVFNKSSIMVCPVWLAWFFISMTLIINILIISRGGLLISIIYIILILYFFLKRQKIILSFQFQSLLVSLLFICIIIFSISTLAENMNYQNMIMGRFGFDKEMSVAGIKELYSHNLRIQIWDASFRIFQENFLTGVGLGNIRTEMLAYEGFDFDSHNLLLDIFAEQGVFSGIIFLVIVFTLTWRVFRMAVKEINLTIKNINLGLYLGILIFCIHGIFLTGSKLITTDETVSGFGAYFLFISMALQDYLWQRRNDDIITNSSLNNII